MEVTLLFFDGCPNWQRTRARLEQALRLVGRHDFDIRLCKVGTTEQAERMGMRGSPTVLIDGEDPFATPQTPVGLACRLFQTPDGVAGAPTVEQLVVALTT